jgi:hypothetical protein
VADGVRRPPAARRAPLSAVRRSPSKTLDGRVRAWARQRYFLDANRWRDVVYVLVLFPLAIIELFVALFLWAASLTLLAMPLVVAGMSVGGAFERLSTR